MYQVYNQPTKFPLSQGSVIQKNRQHHDKLMKQVIKHPNCAIDNKEPSHFPMRFSRKNVKIENASIKRENKRLVQQLLRARSDATIVSSKGKHVLQKRRTERFFSQSRDRRRHVRSEQIQRENLQMLKRLQSTKSDYTSKRFQKHNRQRREYMKRRQQNRQHDLFASPKSFKRTQKHFHKKKSIELPPIYHSDNKVSKQPTVEKQTSNISDISNPSKENQTKSSNQ